MYSPSGSLVFDSSKLSEQIDRYLSTYPEDRERIAPLLEHLNRSSEIFGRSIFPGHATASGIVIQNNKILMVFHPTLKKWLQPGGHIEDGESPFLAARREILEETCMQTAAHPWQLKNFMPIDIDVHAIPSNPHKRELAHLHYDFRYLFLAGRSVKSFDDTAHQTEWRRVQDVEEPNLQSLIGKLGNMNILPR